LGEIEDQTAVEDVSFAFTVPESMFRDEDSDVLEWFASRSNGSALPAWLSFDVASRTFAGTPANDDVGSLDLRVAVRDSSGLAASHVFEIEVANENDAPTVAQPIGERSFEAEAAFILAVPAVTFADEDRGDRLTLAASMYGGDPLPPWLGFDAASKTFHGNPGSRENGIWHIELTATDEAGESVSTDFGLIIHAKAGSTVSGSKGDDAIYGGTGNEVLVAKGGDDALFGEAGNDVLLGGGGLDVLQGGSGGDILHGGGGHNVLDGGAGGDFIFGGRGSSLIVGGIGNDFIHTGRGNDVILFNRGDGTDTVLADRSADNTLSFGGGIGYADLSLSRSGKDLVVSAGGEDRIVLREWYAGKRSVSHLQFVLDTDYDPTAPDGLYDSRVQTFDFLGMVGAFDRARDASPGLTSWDVTNALLQFHLSAADDAAIGGDLAYWYARNRGLAGISVAAAQQAIGAAGFGSDAQSLRPFGGLSEGFAKLV
jgi:Ca2+-binding RTX toxin-like protein